jgi:superfamily II DNA or RNA helicase
LRKKFPAEKFPNLDLDQYKLTAKQLEMTKHAYEKGTLRYAIATKTWRQGVDMSHLACIIRADGDVSEIECVQVPGRAARLDKFKENAYLIDFSDTFSAWARQRAEGREAWYKKNQWTCVTFQEVLDGLCRQAEGNHDVDNG